ncbi:MAG: hypothetical protein DHS20C01_38010 [marine bacterium B5-7]|nr:MAG: hypothetical protein DHS20C01_38010 [marine bacterium B5-7]
MMVTGKKWMIVRAWFAGICFLIAVPPTFGSEACPAEQKTALMPLDPVICRALDAAVRTPGKLPLDVYEEKLSQYFNHFCHRDSRAGWVRDKQVRDTGPFTSPFINGREHPRYQGTHAPVVIWYSPEMAAWVKEHRGMDDDGKPGDGAPVPAGAMMVKEMYPAPAARCADVDPFNLLPTSGAAIMVRAPEVSHDGWYWGWFGWSGWNPDYPADNHRNRLAYQGFGQYCVNCHSSARDNLTFAAAANMAGEPGRPIAYYDEGHIVGDQPPQTHHETVTTTGEDPNRLDQPHQAYNPDFLEVFPVSGAPPPNWDTVSMMPSQTYDNVFMPAHVPNDHGQYITSDQCLGCHDAGSTGLQFDMTERDPKTGKLFNHSPYGTWAGSPMALAGRDPIFFAQLASETQSFHSNEAPNVESICLGCHGVMGQRQYEMDEYATSGECPPFRRESVAAVPWPADNPHAGQADYGALARDGISCMVCHTMVIGEKATRSTLNSPRNACVEQRQDLLNPGYTGFAKTFTGSFLSQPTNRIAGPIREPMTWPMKTALGLEPYHDETVKGAEICGTCHTVHLPVLHQGRTVGRIYEQTTYAEWAFSDYRTGQIADGTLPEGAGASPQSCQDCHMPSSGVDGKAMTSKVASIQEFSNFPATSFTTAPENIDLSLRQNYSKHNLVGLNLFLVKMAQQFPDVLGIRTQDPMLVSKGVDPMIYTADQMTQQAVVNTAKIMVLNTKLDDNSLKTTLKVINLVGHKFPSGVGFRRAILSFRVKDVNGKVLWSSGATDTMGRVLDGVGNVLPGELWWKDDCSALIEPDKRLHQPHYQIINSQDQVQIYQELVSTPPSAGDIKCSHDAEPRGHLTTSFLSICAEVKDNRLLPAGYLSLEKRTAISRALGAGEILAADAGSTAVGDDPDYRPGNDGSDTIVYDVPLADLDGKQMVVEAELFYQATPPFYLQDRFCTAKGADRDRLHFVAGHLNVEGSAIQDWKLKVAGTGEVAVSDVSLKLGE